MYNARVGLMIRFGAGPDEIAGLMKFLRRRAPQERLLLAPLPDVMHPTAPTIRHRPRVTASPLLRDLETHTRARRWGMAISAPDARPSLTESDFLIQFFFGPADALGRRDVLLEVRDEMTGDPPYLTERAEQARKLGEKAMRRLRRRGTRDGNVWTLR